MEILNPRYFCLQEVNQIAQDMSSFLIEQPNNNYMIYIISGVVFLLIPVIAILILKRFPKFDYEVDSIAFCGLVAVFLLVYGYSLGTQPIEDRFLSVLSFDRISSKIVIDINKNEKKNVVMPNSIKNAQNYLDILMLERSQELDTVPNSYVNLISEQLQLDDVVMLQEGVADNSDS